jgi:hypothetical protein
MVNTLPSSKCCINTFVFPIRLACWPIEKSLISMLKRRGNSREMRGQHAVLLSTRAPAAATVDTDLAAVT